jgi:hypothetical protein
MHDEVILFLICQGISMIIGAALGWLGAIYREGKTQCPRCHLEWYPTSPIVEISEERPPQ